LQFIGVKHAVALKSANGQGLGIVFESVRRRFTAFVNHAQCFVHLQFIIVFHQNEISLRPIHLDGARLHIAGHAQVPCISHVAHGMQFLNGDVIALAFLRAQIGHVGHNHHNQADSSPEGEISFPCF
jgi:hypothetical protein